MRFTFKAQTLCLCRDLKKYTKTKLEGSERGDQHCQTDKLMWKNHHNADFLI